MRTEKLKPDTDYATETGHLVSTGPDRPERGWYEYNAGNDKGKTVRKGLPGEGEPVEDPWSPTAWSVGGKRSMRVTPELVLRNVREGVPVTRWETDADGKKTGEGEQTVVDPKHIKGTWADYMSLHADTVRCRAEYERSQGDVSAEYKRVYDRLRAAGVNVESHDVHVSIGCLYLVNDHRGDLVEKPHLGRGKPFESYRMVPEVRLKGEWAEAAINALTSDGH